jgi:hypothetical protein
VSTTKRIRAGALRAIAPTLLLVAAVHCGSADESAIEGGMGDDGYYPVPGANTGMGGSSAMGGSGTGGTLPPEVEIEAGFEAPVLTGKYMWSANPESNRVAVVDAETLRVRTLEAGFAPTYLSAVPTDPSTDETAAIVLNVRGENATLFHLTGGEPEDPLTFPTHPRANSWAISESGKWAVAWSDARAFEIVDPTDSFQNLTLILVAPESGEPRAMRRVAGYRPSSVSFDAAEENLIVVSEHGLTVIDLTDEANPQERDLVALSDDDSDPAARDVVVTADGETALVRVEGSNVIDFVNVGSGEISPVALAGAVTDLDVSQDGTLAVAVMRDRGEAALLPVPLAATDPTTIDTVTLGGLFGSVSLAPDASTGVLYTNAIPVNDVLTLQLTGDDALTTRVEDLRAPVRGVWVAPDAEHAVALLDPPAGSVKAGAFGVVSTRARRAPLIEGTDAPAMEVALGPAGTNIALITIRDDLKQVYGVHVVELSTLQEDFLPLTSPPLSAGIIPALNKGFVAQEHPEGRITFIEFPENVTDGSAPTPTSTTLTGFELAARVVYPTGSGK